MTKRGIVPLADKSSDVILAHILDPEHTELSPSQTEEFKHVLAAAKLIDDYPDDRHVLTLMKHKYNVSVTQLRRDIAHAKELFKTEHTFDYDLTFAWMIKDQIELIRECKLTGNFKEWNAAKKTLRELIGERPVSNEDPRRMMKNEFYIQIVNGGGQPVSVPLGRLQDLSPEDIQLVQESMMQPIESDEQADELFNR